IKTRFIPYHDLANADRYFSRKTRMLFLETPTNPTLRCVDLAALAEIGHRHKACVVVDNTFATPVLQKPLALGADIVMHSATKYLGGHSDLTAGVLVGPEKWMERAREMMILTGACLDPRCIATPSQGVARVLPRAPRARRPRAGEAANGRLRHDGFVRRARRRAGGRALHQTPEAVVPGDQPWRSRVHPFLSGAVVARRTERQAVEAARGFARDRPTLSRNRGCERPHRRSRSGAGLGSGRAMARIGLRMM